MVDHILKLSRPGVCDIRCLSWNTAIIVFMKSAAWVEDDLLVVTEFPCLLGHPVLEFIPQPPLPLPSPS